jgi:hypothetical protein
LPRTKPGRHRLGFNSSLVVKNNHGPEKPQKKALNANIVHIYANLVHMQTLDMCVIMVRVETDFILQTLDMCVIMVRVETDFILQTPGICVMKGTSRQILDYG